MAAFWISLIKVSQGLQYASGSKYASPEYEKVVNMQGLYRVVNMPEYLLKMPQNELIYLNKA